jgi:hypothetical protein
MCHSTSVEDLHKDFSSFLVDGIDDLLPALRLLLIVNVSLAGESQPPLGDGG